MNEKKNDLDNGDKKFSMLSDAKADALLETSDCTVSNSEETKTLKIGILIDSRSQKTFISDTLKIFLQLDPIRKEILAI